MTTLDLKEIINNVNSTKDIKIIIDQLRDLKQSIFQINSDNSNDNHITITSILKLLIENVLDNWYFAFTEPDKQLFESFFFIPNILLESFITVTTILIEHQPNNNSNNNINHLYSQKLLFLYNILYKFINNNYLSKLFIEFINRKINKQQNNNSSNSGSNEIYESIWNLIVNSICSIPDKSRSIQYYYKNNSRIRGGIQQSPLSNIKEYILEYFTTNSIYYSKIIEQITISINNIIDNQNKVLLVSNQISILFTKMIKTGDKDIIINKFFEELFRDTKDTNIIKLKRKVQSQIIIRIHGSCLDTFLESFIKSLPNFSKDSFNNIYKNLILDLYNDYDQTETSMIFHILFNKILVLKELDNNTQNCLLELLYQLLKVEKTKKSNGSDNRNGILKSYEEEQEDEINKMKKENQPILYIILFNLLKSWKDSYFIRHCTNEHHSYITRSIIYFIQKANDSNIIKLEEKQLDTLKSMVLNGIDLHLKISISNVNVRGMFVAEIFSKLFYNSQAENQLKFDYTLDTPDQKCFSTNYIPIFNDKDNNSNNNKNNNSNNSNNINNSSNNSKSNSKNQMDHYKELLEKEFSKYDDPDMEMVQQDDEDYEEEQILKDQDSGNNQEKRKAYIEEIDEEEEILKDQDSDDDLVPYDLDDDESDLNPNSKKKIYLRDCLLELQSSKHTAESWENSLLSIAKIVWSKPDDLDELSEQLAISLLHLTNEYDLDGFSQYRHEALVALATQSPSIVIPYLTYSFKQPNFSVGQRLEILDTISESAKELSGFNNNNNNQKQPNNKFEIQQQIQQQPKLINEIGIVRRWGNSKNIKRPIIKRNQFYQYVTLYFYPLLERYDKVTQCYSMDLLGYDSFLLSRLIFTLGVIVECSGNSIDSRKISKELVIFCFSLRNHQDTNVRRSILFSLSRVFYSNESMTKQIIDQDYHDEIEDLVSFLYDISQSDSDSDSRIMALTTLSKILNLLKLNF